MLSMELAPPLTQADRAAANWRRAALLVFALVAVALPFFSPGYLTFEFSRVIILAIALLGLNLLTGYNGQISLGHGAFFAIGGYASAILTSKFGVPYWATLPITGLICFGAGFLFGFPALRLGGLYLALATFALALAVPQLLKFKPFDPWTGGVQGLVLSKPQPPLHLPLTRDQWLYFVSVSPLRRCSFGSRRTWSTAASAAQWSPFAIIRSRPRRWASTPR